MSDDQKTPKDVSGPRPWWIENPTSFDEHHLCDICRHINFKFLVSNNLPSRHALKLGLLRDIFRKDKCAFCRMVVHAISITYKVNILEKVENEAKDTFCELLNDEKRARGRDMVYTLEIMIYNDNGTIDSGDDSAMIHYLADEKNPRPNEGRLVSRNQGEMSQLKKWLHNCENVHPSSDTDRARNLAPKNLSLRVIDVESQCIINAPQHTRYMALGYVWGGPQELQYAKTTQSELERPNGLSIDDERLPGTIKDAMLLVSRFDERYLWVDSLCIMQDDAENKHDQIALMDVIYQCAILTIVAVSGKSAGAGLPGVRTGSREVRQHIEHVQGLKLTNALLRPASSIDSSVWNSRAWTYQEWKLSRRLLLFADEQITWKCDHVSCWEDEFEPEFRVSEMEPGSAGRALDRDYSPDRLPLKGRINFRMYALAVENYSLRSLSFDSDALNAFAGIMNYLRPIMRSGYVYGLPEAELDEALLWQPVGLIKRRVYSDSGNPIFPSWTWAGWIGPVHYLYADVFSEVTWRAIDSQGFSSEEYRYPSDCRDQNDGKWEHRNAGFWHYYVHSDAPDTYYLHPTALEIERPPRPRLDTTLGRLLFWALSAHFDITGDHNIYTRVGDTELCNDGQHVICLLSMFDREGHLAGTVHIPGPIASKISKGSHEFILLSRTRLDEKNLYDEDPLKVDKERLANWSLEHTPFEVEDDAPSDIWGPKYDFDHTRYDAEKFFCVYNVMLVEWKEGVAYRLGLGWVHIDAFHQAFPERKFITLG